MQPYSMVISYQNIYVLYNMHMLKYIVMQCLAYAFKRKGPFSSLFCIMVGTVLPVKPTAPLHG